MHAGTFSKGIHKIPNLKIFLEAEKITLYPSAYTCSSINSIIGWGRKTNAIHAAQTAKYHNLPFYTLEDGFIRSVGLGRAGKPSISMVVDPVGIHYDATQPSELENLLNDDENFRNKELIEQSKQAINFILQHKISKYNGAPDVPEEKFSINRNNVLIIDQVAEDPSITFGTHFNLKKIISIAINENPNAKIYVKLHPESIAGYRKGIFSKQKKLADIEFIRQDYNPISILKKMDKIYVATSQMGFEALLMDKEVICFGMPFYAGWGLTDDRVECSRRKTQRSKAEIFAAAYILYSRYVHPVSGKRCDIFSALNYISQQLKMERLNQRNVFCFGIRHWTRANIKPFIRSNQNNVFFVKSLREAISSGIKKGDQIVIWGTRAPDGLSELVQITGGKAACIEDGFLRSVGLGSDFVRPSSLVLDHEGIYFDPSKPSDLETLLQNTEFTVTQLEQAASVREKIIQSRLTKYNLEPNKKLETDATPKQTIILVPGQVEDDASVRLGCQTVNTNLKLIQAVRNANPDAYIIYKPHPDVASGNRIGAVHPDTALKYCNQYVELTGIATCLEAVDEVHTMTSLVGFEAIMRKIPVTAYGQPFYAGWKLTRDKLPITRRSRHLSLDELVAGALLLYPRYYDWNSSSFTDCESTIEKLIHARKSAEYKTGLSKLQLSYRERRIKKLGMLIKGLVHAP